MTGSQQRKSVLTILLTRVLAIVILFNIILAVWNIVDTVKMQKQNAARLQANIQNEIISLIGSWESAVRSIENIFHTQHIDVLNKMIDMHSVYDLKYVDLVDLQLELGIDTTNIDLYILEDGVVKNTTYLPDLGLNLYNFGESYRIKLNNILEDGGFMPEDFSIEATTKRLKLFSYQATKDRKYIIEVGSYSSIADELMQIFRTRLRNTMESNEDILSINFWVGEEEEYQTGFMDQPVLYSKQDSMIIEADRQKKDFEVRFDTNGRELKAQFIYVELDEDNEYLGNVILTIITDITDYNVPVYNIIKKQTFMTLVFLAVLILILIVATRGFRLVLRDMLQKTTLIASGDLSERVNVTGETEFTTLAEQFNYMVESLEKSQDELINKNEEISAQRDEIEAQRNIALEQKELLAEQKEEIVASINYARRIQQATLPAKEDFDVFMPENFIMFRPKDIVSGDFYWLTNINEKVIIVAADCTGHGVPGAFMSMLGASFLNEVVTKEGVTHPATILNRVRTEIIDALQQKGMPGEQKDGMDMALCSIDLKKRKLAFAGANNPIYIVRDSDKPGLDVKKKIEYEDQVLYEVKGDKMPLAIHVIMNDFQTREIDLLPNDSVYLFTDGFADQFGGREGKKFMYKPFKDLIIQNQELSMDEQKVILDCAFVDWRGDHEQIDDVLVIGLKFP